MVVCGVNDEGRIVGLSDDNFSTYGHDDINRYLKGRSNQPINCQVSKYKIDRKKGGTDNIVFIEVSESREYPIIYTGGMEKWNKSKRSFLGNIALRKGALYVRIRNEIGNKEIETVEEWRELIERTHKKWSRETIRRESIMEEGEDPYKGELNL